jgi:uncharacterized integral membrane protein
MTDATSSRPGSNDNIEDAVVVDDLGSPVDARDAEVIEAEEVEVEPVHVSETEPVIATSDPAAVEFEEPVVASETGSQPQVVYVQAPQPPRKLGNRGVGAALALVSALVFGVLLALVFALIVAAQVGRATFEFLGAPSFYVPILLYAIGTILLVLVVNRAGWAAHVIGSIFVGLFVYFGTIGIIALTGGVVAMTPSEAGVFVASGLTNPYVVAGGFLAREVSLWSGALIARRGRRLKMRNLEARAAYDRDLAQARRDNERAAPVA